jgi:hypothetical protein
MVTISTRLSRLERQQGTEDQRRRQIEADAAAFTKIEALAAGFDERASSADANTQMDWSPAQRLAWRNRFCPIGAAA